ncbi:MAG: threonine--tRNA ligase, partial [Candidatus Pacebacteria bacterium]|nr:threonine--tRNA ligase [Candidatus Paceibacterota bacterium]
METLRHSAAHIMASAVKEIWPDTKLAIGPSIDSGFYYDFDFGDVAINETDFAKIESKMKEIIAKDLPFELYEEDIDKAIDKEKQRGEVYKLELLEDLKSEGEQKVTYYKVGDFEDLCKGPHIKSSGEVKAFKLHKVAGAYWRGDE